MKIEDTPTGYRITEISRFYCYWFILCCWWNNVPMTIEWKPRS